MAADAPLVPPTQSRSTWSFFLQTNRNGMSLPEASKALTKAYKELTEEELAKYKAMELEDVERHRKETEVVEDVFSRAVDGDEQALARCPAASQFKKQFRQEFCNKTSSVVRTYFYIHIKTGIVVDSGVDAISKMSRIRREMRKKRREKSRARISAGRTPWLTWLWGDGKGTGGRGHEIRAGIIAEKGKCPLSELMPIASRMHKQELEAAEAAAGQHG